MINFETNFVKTVTIEQAWRDMMWLVVKNGWDFIVKQGSYVGQIRKQLPFVTIYIEEPFTRPLAPHGLPVGAISPTDDEKIENYFANYIMDPEKLENEEYRYSSFIVPQIDRITHLLKHSNGYTNQACIAIGDTKTTFLPDPPCLRMISFKVIEKRLTMTVFFRSWDAYAGFPENLGGLQLLKEFILSSLQSQGMDIIDGPMIAQSDGLHIYSQYFNIVDKLNIEKIKVNEKVLEEYHKETK